MPLSRFATASAAVLLAATTVAAEEYWVFLGTYTGGSNGSKGIYRARFDAATGKLGEPELAAEMGSPSFLAIHPTGKFLYAVGEGGGKDGGAVVAFALDSKSGRLTKLNENKSGGAGPCHIAVSPKGDYAAVANYGGGSTALFKLDEDGKIVDRVGFVQHKGKSVNQSRQKEPHAHFTFFNPKGDHVGTVDLGIDKVKVFKIDPQAGLVELETADIVTPPGSGPRHMALSPGGEVAYICGELDSTVNAVVGGKVVQSLSTLPKPTPGNSTAECILSPDGKFVYVSNRGHNSIAVFKVNADHKLTAAGHITGDIKIPRNFNIEPGGRWMLIASQDGGKVGVWELDAATGLGKETGNTIPVGRCVCVKFVPIPK
jgi:6-phosphogluconolactonase